MFASLALLTDVVHIVIVVPLLIFGSWFIDAKVFAFFAAITIGLQLAFLHCPMVILSSWLRSKARNEPWNKSAADRGLVWWLYSKFGVVAIIPIVAGITLSAYMITRAL